MQAISISRNKKELTIKIDTEKVSPEFSSNLLKRLRLEELSLKVDFDAKALEAFGKEIKGSWWKKNKEWLLKIVDEKVNDR